MSRPDPEHAGEALTVQLAAYVREAQRYAAPDIPPLLETVDELRADFRPRCALLADHRRPQRGARAAEISGIAVLPP